MVLQSESVASYKLNKAFNEITDKQSYFH